MLPCAQACVFCASVPAGLLIMRVFVLWGLVLAGASLVSPAAQAQATEKPSTPRNLVAKAGNTAIDLTWDEPASNGGSDLTTYKLSWNPSSKGGVSETAVSASVSEYTITNLTNGQKYTITLLAENVIGEGPSTELSAMPATMPSMPVIISAEAGAREITVAWRIANDGGARVNSYTLTWAQTGGGPGSGTVTVALGNAQRVNSVPASGVSEVWSAAASHEGVLYILSSGANALYTLDPVTARMRFWILSYLYPAVRCRSEKQDQAGAQARTACYSLKITDIRMNNHALRVGRTVTGMLMAEEDQASAVCDLIVKVQQRADDFR